MKTTGGAGSSSGKHRIYHEKQTRELCALHTLNNLFQGKQPTLVKCVLEVVVANIFDLYTIRTRTIHETSARRDLSIVGAQRMDQSTSFGAGTRQL